MKAAILRVQRKHQSGDKRNFFQKSSRSLGHLSHQMGINEQYQENKPGENQEHVLKVAITKYG